MDFEGCGGSRGAERRLVGEDVSSRRFARRVKKRHGAAVQLPHVTAWPLFATYFDDRIALEATGAFGELRVHLAIVSRGPSLRGHDIAKKLVVRPIRDTLWPSALGCRTVEFA